MCYPEDSVELMTSSCAMCRVFNTGSSVCPHKPMGVCTNRVNHPRHNVVYFRSAEARIFNGCGFCKYAQKKPPQSEKAAWSNPGWPGCCRPPRAHESDWIDEHDWPAVNKRFGVTRPNASEPRRPDNNSSTSLGLDRERERDRDSTHRRSGSTHHISTKATGTSNSKSSPVTITSPTRSGSGDSARGAELIRNYEWTGSSSSLAAAGSDARGTLQTSSYTSGNPLENLILYRNPPRSSKGNSSGGTSSASSTIREPRADNRRPSLSVPPVRPSLGLTSAPPSENPQLVRRATTSNPPTAPVSAPSRKSDERKRENTPISSSVPRSSHLVDAMSKLAIETARPSTSTRAPIEPGESTITSDGGFTDYLSDESDQELQRQAVERAAQIEERRAEEHEFRSARQQLQSVTLQPPRSWNPGPQPPKQYPSLTSSQYPGIYTTAQRYATQNIPSPHSSGSVRGLSYATAGYPEGYRQ